MDAPAIAAGGITADGMLLRAMDLFAVTRKLVDIESISGNERAVGEFLLAHISGRGYTAERMPVEKDRFNVYAHTGTTPRVVFSTHMDVVPPWFPSSEDERRIYGRGACDAKGIIAAQLAAAERLRAEGMPVGLLFVVGEERDSLGARVANRKSPRPKFLINGEPTENRIGVASKGALRVEITARGKLAHSAYPELGDSAVEKLVEALARLRVLKLPEDSVIGACTCNIGVIEGGHAPNVIPDFAKAQLLYRLVGPAEDLKHRIVESVGNLAEVEFVLEIPPVRLRTVEGVPTMVAAFTTDIPALNDWGEPVLLGPGSIHVAHTEHEYVEKQALLDAVDLYCSVARKL